MSCTLDSPGLPSPVTLLRQSRTTYTMQPHQEDKILAACRCFFGTVNEDLAFDPLDAKAK